MPFYEHIDEWLGYPVVGYDASSADPVDYAGTIYRIERVNPIREGLLVGARQEKGSSKQAA